MKGASMKKGIGLGIDDFRQIIKEDCYYFDKTNWIEELLKDRSQTKLFTRPRRFGKTLNMSTLKYFFDAKNAKENRKLFKDLYIEKSEYFKEQGQYPVIFISLKDLKKNTWEDAFFELKALLREVYEEHSYIKEKLSDTEKEEYDKILMKADDAEYGRALRNLTISSKKSPTSISGSSSLASIVNGIGRRNLSIPFLYKLQK